MNAKPEHVEDYPPVPRCGTCDVELVKAGREMQCPKCKEIPWGSTAAPSAPELIAPASRPLKEPTKPKPANDAKPLVFGTPSENTISINFEPDNKDIPMRLIEDGEYQATYDKAIPCRGRRDKRRIAVYFKITSEGVSLPYNIPIPKSSTRNARSNIWKLINKVLKGMGYRNPRTVDLQLNIDPDNPDDVMRQFCVGHIFYVRVCEVNTDWSGNPRARPYSKVAEIIEVHPVNSISDVGS